jgi:ketosteroid isomerase-like protein
MHWDLVKDTHQYSQPRTKVNPYVQFVTTTVALVDLQAHRVIIPPPLRSGAKRAQDRSGIKQRNHVMSMENEVRKASQQFYAALNRMVNGNAAAMADVWAHSDTVTAMHPIGGRDVGWEAVRGSFEKVAQISTNGEVALKDQLIHIAGDTAYEVGIEQGQLKLAGHHANIEHRVTNIYQRVAGAWKIVHHHTDTSAAMLEVLSRLQPPSGKQGG